METNARPKRNPERWKHLCALAAEEQNPVRLSKLIHEICELLDGRHDRLEVKPSEPVDPPHPQERTSETRAPSAIQNRQTQAEKELQTGAIHTPSRALVPKAALAESVPEQEITGGAPLLTLFEKA